MFKDLTHPIRDWPMTRKCEILGPDQQHNYEAQSLRISAIPFLTNYLENVYLTGDEKNSLDTY